MNRLLLALKAFWRILTEPDFGARVEPLFSRVPTGPDLRILAVLQRDGRLVDFLQEDIDAYSDAQIGPRFGIFIEAVASPCTIT